MRKMVGEKFDGIVSKIYVEGTYKGFPEIEFGIPKFRNVLVDEGLSGLEVGDEVKVKVVSFGLNPIIELTH
jgi:hypothetical protein